MALNGRNEKLTAGNINCRIMRQLIFCLRLGDQAILHGRL